VAGALFSCRQSAFPAFGIFAELFFDSRELFVVNQ
jgi:hypothetical protein